MPSAASCSCSAVIVRGHLEAVLNDPSHPAFSDALRRNSHELRTAGRALLRLMMKLPGDTPRRKLTIRGFSATVNIAVNVSTDYVRISASNCKLLAMERFEDKVKRDFAKRLKEARLEAGYKHATQFAQAMGEEEHTYRAWERGQYLPDIPKMARLCQLLGLEPNELVPLAVQKKGTTAKASGSGRSAA